MKLFHKKPISSSPVKSRNRKFILPIFNVPISPPILVSSCIGISFDLIRLKIVVFPTPAYPTNDIFGGNAF